MKFKRLNQIEQYLLPKTYTIDSRKPNTVKVHTFDNLYVVYDITDCQQPGDKLRMFFYSQPKGRGTGMDPLIGKN